MQALSPNRTTKTVTNGRPILHFPSSLAQRSSSRSGTSMHYLGEFQAGLPMNNHGVNARVGICPDAMVASSTHWYDSLVRRYEMFTMAKVFLV